MERDPAEFARAYCAAQGTGRASGDEEDEEDGDDGPLEDDVGWTDENLLFLFERAKNDMAAGRKPDYWAILEHMGWDKHPNVQRILPRLRNKYGAMRRVVESGAEFHKRLLPKATMMEVAAAIEADPAYEPHLDRRPQTTDGTRLERWQKQVGRILTSRAQCGFINTGMKKSGRFIYRYDPAADKYEVGGLASSTPASKGCSSVERQEGPSATGGQAAGAGATASKSPVHIRRRAGRASTDGAKVTAAGLAGQVSQLGTMARKRGWASGGLAAAQHSTYVEAAALAALAALERGQEVLEAELAAAVGRSLAGV
ncbi:hypothetical protein GPECTOR_20g492 [Gonium pectorale]|uniref:Uncharacterized protein n=1 Tax=Gonium pectorale TaxID=33097 RepID=A0A150GIV4_GONPE|nr:hypothetical protein GPECTOR_20g492 [Gonium pectorale]|eukprot:KXZ49635.1 hypothetical protein GPECTOR_20g492 [Gonium pectorale]